MGRYEAQVGVEGEYEPGSRGRVLRNLRGIKSKREMDQAETVAFLSAQQRYISIVTDQMFFSAAFICQMHRDWLGGIYEWAGRYRTVEMSKGNFTWPPAHLVAQNMMFFELHILKPLTPCRPGTVEDVAMALAKVQAEFLLVHPFREGNGRISRWITNLMALQAGYPELDYGFTGQGMRKNSREYLAGVIEGYAGDYERLARFLAEALRRGFLRAGAGSLTPRAPSK
jgi:cell filamentation protein